MDRTIFLSQAWAGSASTRGCHIWDTVIAGVGTGSVKQCTGTPLPCPALTNDCVTKPTWPRSPTPLPTIATALDVSPAASVWVVNAYQLALVMALLPCAALGESVGLRRVFTGGIALFTAASLLCSLAPSLPWLVAARFLQGLGGAAVVSLGIGLMRFTYPHRLLGTVIGWNATVIALSAAAGPTIGAAILTISRWPFLFAVNLPVGLIVLAAARALPQPPGTGRTVDLPSAALNAVAFACLILGVDRSTHAPELAAGLLVLSAISFVALVRREMPRAVPLIPLDLLRSRPFRISVIASICCFAGQMASTIALPFYLQQSLGQDAFITGLYMTPWPLVVAVAGPISGRLADRMSNGLLCAAGGAFLALGLEHSEPSGSESALSH